MVMSLVKAPAAAPAGPLDGAARQRTLGHLQLASRLAWRQFEGCGRTVPLEELRGEALYALVYGASLFDESKGVPFGAYVTMVIRHRLIQAVTVWRRDGRLAHTRFTDLAEFTAGHRDAQFDTPCPRTREAPDEVSAEELLERVRRLLPEHWFAALQLRYAQEHTLEEIGQKFGVSRERVRQWLAAAIERVRWHFPDLTLVR